ncbi:MAG TPA: hypothetical protein VND64_26280 [Pirellulales bacterium]|nr:hypothetical protein [Pirellulales bacterium]
MILKQPYEDVAGSSDVERDRALRLAEASNDALLKLVLQVLAHRGSDFHYGQGHAVRFRVVMELIKTETDEIVHEEIINRGGQKHFADYWGKWLNRYHDEKSSDLGGEVPECREE